MKVVCPLSYIAVDRYRLRGSLPMCQGLEICWICPCDKVDCAAKMEWEYNGPGHLVTRSFVFSRCRIYARRTYHGRFLPPCIQWTREYRVFNRICDFFQQDCYAE